MATEKAKNNPKTAQKTLQKKCQQLPKYFIKPDQMDRYMMQTRIVYLEKEESKTSQMFTILTPKLENLVDFAPIIQNVEDWHHKYFQIYSPEQDSYIPMSILWDDRFRVHKQYLQLSVVMIRYLNKDDQENSEDESKKERSKERTIKDVINLVKRWRQLHTQTSDSKKMNLQEAAKIIGISKKSLDDYFFQLRMGEKYNFDFGANMGCKMGVLRSFVKDYEGEAKKISNQKITKHQKKLKIIDQFEKKLSLEERVSPSEDQEVKTQQDNKKKIECRFNCSLHFHKLMDSQQLFWGSPFSPIEQKDFIDCQNNFFKDFENLMEEPNDPFIPFANFKKAKSIFGDDQNSSQQMDF